MRAKGQPRPLPTHTCMSYSNHGAGLYDTGVSETRAQIPNNKQPSTACSTKHLIPLGTSPPVWSGGENVRRRARSGAPGIRTHGEWEWSRRYGTAVLSEKERSARESRLS